VIASRAKCDQSLLRKGQFRLRSKNPQGDCCGLQIAAEKPFSSIPENDPPFGRALRAVLRLSKRAYPWFQSEDLFFVLE
jgi:hypothetical protein